MSVVSKARQSLDRAHRGCHAVPSSVSRGAAGPTAVSETCKSGCFRSVHVELRKQLRANQQLLYGRSARDELYVTVDASRQRVGVYELTEAGGIEGRYVDDVQDELAVTTTECLGHAVPQRRNRIHSQVPVDVDYHDFIARPASNSHL
jgi:hypothetical protein